MKTGYCSLCKRDVVVKKNFNWVVFLLFCLTGIGGIFYIAYYLIKKKDRCPICGCKIDKYGKKQKELDHKQL
ncbi:MAG: hypothetical protein ACRCX8_01475 [Sarcina sp.]